MPFYRDLRHGDHLRIIGAIWGDLLFRPEFGMIDILSNSAIAVPGISWGYRFFNGIRHDQFRIEKCGMCIVGLMMVGTSLVLWIIKKGVRKVLSRHSHYSCGLPDGIPEPFDNGPGSTSGISLQ